MQHAINKKTIVPDANGNLQYEPEARRTKLSPHESSIMDHLFEMTYEKGNLGRMFKMLRIFERTGLRIGQVVHQMRKRSNILNGRGRNWREKRTLKIDPKALAAQRERARIKKERRSENLEKRMKKQEETIVILPESFRFEPWHTAMFEKFYESNKRCICEDMKRMVAATGVRSSAINYWFEWRRNSDRPYVDPSLLPPKQKRIHYPEEVRDVLVTFYKKQKYANAEEYEELVAATGLTKTQVIEWFSGRRKYEKRAINNYYVKHGLPKKYKIRRPLGEDAQTLKAFYEKSPYPTMDQKERVAARMKELTRKQVMQWFQDRKRRMRDAQKKARELEKEQKRPSVPGPSKRPCARMEDVPVIQFLPAPSFRIPKKPKASAGSAPPPGHVQKENEKKVARNQSPSVTPPAPHVRIQKRKRSPCPLPREEDNQGKRKAESSSSSNTPPKPAPRPDPRSSNSTKGTSSCRKDDKCTVQEARNESRRKRLFGQPEAAVGDDSRENRTITENSATKAFAQWFQDGKRRNRDDQKKERESEQEQRRLPGRSVPGPFSSPAGTSSCRKDDKCPVQEARNERLSEQSEAAVGEGSRDERKKKKIPSVTPATSSPNFLPSLPVSKDTLLAPLHHIQKRKREEEVQSKLVKDGEKTVTKDVEKPKSPPSRPPTSSPSPEAPASSSSTQSFRIPKPAEPPDAPVIKFLPASFFKIPIKPNASAKSAPPQGHVQAGNAENVARNQVPYVTPPAPPVQIQKRKTEHSPPPREEDDQRKRKTEPSSSSRTPSENVQIEKAKCAPAPRPDPRTSSSSKGLCPSPEDDQVITPVPSPVFRIPKKPSASTESVAEAKNVARNKIPSVTPPTSSPHSTPKLPVSKAKEVQSKLVKDGEKTMEKDVEKPKSRPSRPPTSTPSPEAPASSSSTQSFRIPKKARTPAEPTKPAAKNVPRKHAHLRVKVPALVVPKGTPYFLPFGASADYLRWTVQEVRQWAQFIGVSNPLTLKVIEEKGIDGKRLQGIVEKGNGAMHEMGIPFGPFDTIKNHLCVVVNKMNGY
ncbi:unnamed protein product [Caenorhabditis sp. 36 PRJEB53466]|nr:unnamed protein product [Caenorhabditis sp. 36 PRJEB53466]